MKLNQYGYYNDEKKIHGYVMNMGELKLLIMQKLIEKGREEIKIRIVDCECGEVEEYSNLADFAKHDFNNSFEILVYDIHVVHMNTTNEDIVVANISDDHHNEDF